MPAQCKALEAFFVCFNVGGIINIDNHVHTQCKAVTTHDPQCIFCPYIGYLFTYIRPFLPYPTYYSILLSII